MRDDWFYHSLKYGMSTLSFEGNDFSLYINIEWRDLYVQLLYEVCLLARLKKNEAREIYEHPNFWKR